MGKSLIDFRSNPQNYVQSAAGGGNMGNMNQRANQTGAGSGSRTQRFNQNNPQSQHRQPKNLTTEDGFQVVMDRRRGRRSQPNINPNGTVDLDSLPAPPKVKEEKFHLDNKSSFPEWMVADDPNNPRGAFDMEKFKEEMRRREGKSGNDMDNGKEGQNNAAAAAAAAMLKEQQKAAGGSGVSRSRFGGRFFQMDEEDGTNAGDQGANSAPQMHQQPHGMVGGAQNIAPVDPNMLPPAGMPLPPFPPGTAPPPFPMPPEVMRMMQQMMINGPPPVPFGGMPGSSAGVNPAVPTSVMRNAHPQHDQPPQPPVQPGMPPIPPNWPPHLPPPHLLPPAVFAHVMATGQLPQLPGMPPVPAGMPIPPAAGQAPNQDDVMRFFQQQQQQQQQAPPVSSQDPSSGKKVQLTGKVMTVEEIERRK